MDNPWITFALTTAIALLVAVAIIIAGASVAWVIRRRWDAAVPLARAARNPFRALVLLTALWVAVELSLPELPWEAAHDVILHGMLIGAIVLGAWLLAAVVLFLEDLGLRRYSIDEPDNRVARRMRTQVLIIRRLTVVVVVIVAAGAVLLTFPGVQAIGASLLASAGLASIVAGLAAQSALANVFAGLQLAFSGAIRVDDVVVVQEQFGRIEEITLTYVVVHVWDDRRLVLPSTYFTTTPFENWTRNRSELLGSVELDLDWRASPADVRTELDRILGETDLWDGRAKVVQVTDATANLVRVRILVSASNAGRLWDLRCFVRERLVTWLQKSGAPPLPRSRVELVDAAPRSRRRESTSGSELFRGAGGGDERGGNFTGPVHTQQAEARSRE